MLDVIGGSFYELLHDIFVAVGTVFINNHGHRGLLVWQVDHV